MARSVFFSFHYQRDVWRVNQIRNLPDVIGTGAAGFKDASLWEEAKKKGDAVVQGMIDAALKGTSVTVVFIGQETAGRKFINYEIDKSIERGNGLVGMQIHHLKDRHGMTDAVGRTPAKLTGAGALVYKYVGVNFLAKHIEEAAVAAGK
jgi:MTH538 TIR-like domain (DUF1863)